MNKLFRSIKFNINSEKHGGVNLKSETYTYLGFFDSGDAILYFSGKFAIKSFFHRRSCDYFGSYELISGTKIKLNLLNSSNRNELNLEFSISNSLDYFEIENRHNPLEEGRYELVQMDIEEILKTKADIINYTPLYKNPEVESGKYIVKGSVADIQKRKDKWVYAFIDNNPAEKGWVKAEDVKMWTLD